MGWDDHYPYGMIMAGRSGNSGQGDTKYRFISKERDTETGYDWLDVRAYDSRIARFFAPDPLMDQSPLSSWSPYHYSFDNPVLFLDPQGTWPEVKWSSAIASTFGIIGYGTQTVLASFAIPFTGGWSMPIAVHGSTGYVQSIRNLADNLQGKESTHGNIFESVGQVVGGEFGQSVGSLGDASVSILATPGGVRSVVEATKKIGGEILDFAKEFKNLPEFGTKLGNAAADKLLNSTAKNIANSVKDVKPVEALTGTSNVASAVQATAAISTIKKKSEDEKKNQDRR